MPKATGRALSMSTYEGHDAVESQARFLAKNDIGMEVFGTGALLLKDWEDLGSECDRKV